MFCRKVLSRTGHMLLIMPVVAAVSGCFDSQMANEAQTAAASPANASAGAAAATPGASNVKAQLHSSSVIAPLLVSAPAQNSTAVGTIAIAGSAPGYLNVEVSCNGTLLGRTTPAQSGAFNVSVPTASLPNGAQTLVVNAWNSPAGQPYTMTDSTTITVQVANGAAAASLNPTLYQLSVATPVVTAAAGGSMSVAGSALGFLNVELSYDGILLGRTTPAISGAFIVSATTSSLPKSAATLTLKAWNSPAGQPYTHTSQASVRVQIAAGSPASVATPSAMVTGAKLLVTSPAQNSQAAGALVLTGSAPGFLNVEVSFNGILLGRATPSAAGTFTVSMSTMSLPDGPQTLVLNAWDSSAGQSYTHTAQTTLALSVANGAVKITDFGAIPDGVTDNITAITNAIASAKARGVSVFIPAGTFAYSNLITLTGVKMFGVGNASILYAQDWSRESIFVYGDGSEVRQLELTGVTPPGRVAPWEATRITLFGATHFVIDHVTILGSAAAGIQTATSANNGKITNNTVMNTLSDSIHITDKASYITLQNNHVENSGDDGIAVVSYLNDGDYVSNITAKNNTVLNNKWGRNMSVVGGKNIVYENNDLEYNANWACLYLAQEGSYNTFGDVNVSAEFNTLKECGNQTTGHGAIMLITTGSGQNTNVQLIRNDVVQTGNAGIRVFGANQAIIIDSNRVTGAAPALDIETSGVTLTPYTGGSVGYSPVPIDPIP